MFERQNLLDRLQLGLYMTTYEDINYAGDRRFWRGNNAYVGDDWNDRTSSFTVDYSKHSRKISLNALVQCARSTTQHRTQSVRTTTGH